MVSAIYLGAFSMVAGERSGVEAMASAFGVGSGGTSRASAERLETRAGEVKEQMARSRTRLALLTEAIVGAP